MIATSKALGASTAETFDMAFMFYQTAREHGADAALKEVRADLPMYMAQSAAATARETTHGGLDVKAVRPLKGGVFPLKVAQRALERVA